MTSQRATFVPLDRERVLCRRRAGDGPKPNALSRDAAQVVHQLGDRSEGSNGFYNSGGHGRPQLKQP